MKELLYFAFSDLMVQVEYSKEANSLKYSSHRELSFGERVIVEQYILTNIAMKTDYYRKRPSLFIYLGVDTKLVKELNLYHLKNTLQEVVGKENEVRQKVQELINTSMTAYYFDKIGDQILKLREVMAERPAQEEVNSCLKELSELVDAYNLYADRKISLQEVLPPDLRSRLRGLVIS
ncbi:MAG: hypothetical protein ONB23_02450 [candidate division KSB1 bacterium]|nr:hypothetical protein [candidate division KSB1 bacterium]